MTTEMVRNGVAAAPRWMVIAGVATALVGPALWGVPQFSVLVGCVLAIEATVHVVARFVGSNIEDRIRYHKATLQVVLLLITVFYPSWFQPLR